MRIDTIPNVELFKLGRGHQLFELVILYHLLYDIQTTYEFTFDDDLWESRPVVQLFESCKKFSFPLVSKVRGDFVSLKWKTHPAWRFRLSGYQNG